VGNEQGEEAANDATCEKRAGEVSIAWVMSKARRQQTMPPVKKEQVKFQ